MVKITPTSIFDQILLKGIKSGQMPARTQSSRDWFRKKAKEQSKMTDAKLLRESGRDRLKNTVSSGRMYFFQYDPKHKAKLPYYDSFPLIFMIEAADGGFYGINFHYLNYSARAKLMDALYSITNNETFNETTKLKLSYGVLKAASKFKWFRPAFKRYLKNHVRSRFIEIHPTEWDIALMLPVAAFSKATQNEVWADSARSYSK